MNMDAVQIVFDIIVSIAGFLAGWILNMIWGTLKEQRLENRALADEVHAVKVIVAGEYVKKTEHDRNMDAIFNKLDRIENKIDQKADK